MADRDEDEFEAGEDEAGEAEEGEDEAGEAGAGEAGAGEDGAAVVGVGHHGIAYAWKRKPVRIPPQSSAWQTESLEGSRVRPYQPSYLHDYAGLAEHWINGRYVSRVMGQQSENGTANTQRGVREEQEDEDDLSDSMEGLSIAAEVAGSSRKRRKRRATWNKKRSSTRAEGKDALLLKKLATNEPHAIIRYHAWNRGYADKVPGYFVEYEVFREVREAVPDEGERFHIRRIGDLDWWERLEDDEIPFENRFSDDPTFTVTFHVLNNDPFTGALPEDPDQMTRVFQASNEPNVFRAYSLRTTREACALLRDVRLGIRETLHVRPPGPEQRDRMGAWAEIQGRSIFHMLREPMTRHVLPRTAQLQADADMDFVTETYINMAARMGEDRIYHYTWMEGKHELWDKSQFQDLNVVTWEIWVEFEDDWEGERQIWLHSVNEDSWATVEPRGRKTMVTHVRAEMKFKEEEGDEHNGRWDAVTANFDGSKNAVYMFVKSNSRGVILDRMIVKPIVNDYHATSYENLADDHGFDATPREVHINRLVDKMRPGHRDLFTQSRHYSMRHVGGIETHYLYLQYEPGGSLSSLLRRHVKGVKAHNAFLAAEKRKAREKRRASRKRKAPGDTPEREEPEGGADFMYHLPEIFLWCVFERLLRACCRLRYDPVMQDDQRGFIHHDLKPANMLLRPRPGPGYRSVLDPGRKGTNVRGDAEAVDRIRAAIRAQRRRERVVEEEELGVPQMVEAIARVQEREEAQAEAGTRRRRQEGPGTRTRRRERSETREQEEIPRRPRIPNQRAHPIPILSDLEYCYRIGRDQIWYAFGTHGFVAPEHFPPYPGSPLTTDIFQIGCVMYSLMCNSIIGLPAVGENGRTLGTRATARDFDIDASIRKVDKALNYRMMHSQNLRRLVDVCLLKNEHDRPDPLALLAEVQEGLKAHDKAIGGAVDRNYDDVHRWFRVDGVEEKFVIGEQLPDMAKQRGDFGGRIHPSWDPYGSSAENEFTHMMGSAEDEDVAASGLDGPDSAAGDWGSSSVGGT